MKILYYCLPINESFYVKYNVNGLRKLGHSVTSTFEYNVEAYKNFNDHLFLNTFDLIIYGGFSFNNMALCQNLKYSPAIETKTPVVVTFYDNPMRYLGILADHTNRKKNFYIACCDNNLVQRLNTMGFRTIFNPTCYDPTIQFPGNISEEYSVNIAFAGTVLSPTSINELYKGKSYRDIEILQEMLRRRTPGQFFDYSAFLFELMHPAAKDVGELSFVNLMTQKCLLRFEMFEALKNAGYEINTWGQGDFKSHDNIISHGNLHQHYELPKLYRSAKINLSIELLPSSVHQRVRECLACGGFILLEKKDDNKLSYSQELLSAIEYSNFDEMVEKVKFYLENEEERQAMIKLAMEENKKFINTTVMEQLIVNLENSQ